MDPMTALATFSLAAALLTITPGIDTALVLRTAAIEGVRPALATASGILCGVLLWGLMAAIGIGAILTLSEVLYFLLKMVGAAYLIWLGLNMLRNAVRNGAPSALGLSPHGAPSQDHTARQSFAQGLFSNLLNPKVGIFYVSFLPQFLPGNCSVLGWSVLYALIHVAMGVLWFTALTLACAPISTWLRRPLVARFLEGTTGALLVFFGLCLSLERRVR